MNQNPFPNGFYPIQPGDNAQGVPPMIPPNGGHPMAMPPNYIPQGMQPMMPQFNVVNQQGPPPIMPHMGPPPIGMPLPGGPIPPMHVPVMFPSNPILNIATSVPGPSGPTEPKEGDSEDVWQELRSAEGRKFWHNPKLNKSLWTKPSCLQSDLERYLSGHTLWRSYETAEDSSYWHNTLTRDSSWKTPPEVQTLLDRFDELQTRLNAELPHTKDGDKIIYGVFQDKTQAKELLKCFFEFKGYGEHRNASWDEVSKLWVPTVPSTYRYKKIREADKGSTQDWFPIDHKAFCFTKMTGGERKQCFLEYKNVIQKQIKELNRINKINMREQALQDIVKWDSLFPWSTFEDLADEMHKKSWWYVLDEQEKQHLFEECIEERQAMIKPFFYQLRSYSRDRKLPRYVPFEPDDNATVAANSPSRFDPLLTHNCILLVERLVPDVLRLEWLAFKAVIEGIQNSEETKNTILEYEEFLVRAYKEQDPDSLVSMETSRVPEYYSPSSAMKVLCHMDSFAIFRMYHALILRTNQELSLRQRMAYDAHFQTLQQSYIDLIQKQINVGDITPNSSFRKFLNSNVEDPGPYTTVKLEQITGLSESVINEYASTAKKTLAETLDLTSQLLTPPLTEQERDGKSCEPRTVSGHWAYVHLLGTRCATPREIFDVTMQEIHHSISQGYELISNYLSNKNAVLVDANDQYIGINKFESLLSEYLEQDSECDPQVKEKLALLLDCSDEGKEERHKRFGVNNLLELVHRKFLRKHQEQKNDLAQKSEVDEKAVLPKKNALA